MLIFSFQYINTLQQYSLKRASSIRNILSLNLVSVSQQGSRCVWFPKRNAATDDLSLALSTYIYTAPCAEHIRILRYILRRAHTLHPIAQDTYTPLHNVANCICCSSDTETIEETSHCPTEVLQIRPSWEGGEEEEEEGARWSQTGSVLLPRDTHAAIKGHARYKYIKGTHTLQCWGLFDSCQDTSMQQDRDTYVTIDAGTHSSV